MDFETLNRFALENQDAQAEKLTKEQVDAYAQNKKMVEFLFSYLEPHVKEVASAVISHRGEKQKVTLDTSVLVHNYEKTEFIKKAYTKSYLSDDLPKEDPVGRMIFDLIGFVEKKFRKKLPAFDVNLMPKNTLKISTGEFTYSVTILIQYDKSYYKFEKSLFEPRTDLF